MLVKLAAKTKGVLVQHEACQIEREIFSRMLQILTEDALKTQAWCEVPELRKRWCSESKNWSKADSTEKPQRPGALCPAERVRRARVKGHCGPHRSFLISHCVHRQAQPRNWAARGFLLMPWRHRITTATVPSETPVLKSWAARNRNYGQSASPNSTSVAASCSGVLSSLQPTLFFTQRHSPTAPEAAQSLWCWLWQESLGGGQEMEREVHNQSLAPGADHLCAV